MLTRRPLAATTDLRWREAEPVEAPLPPIVNGELHEFELRLLVDNLPSLCWIADADGYIFWYNRRWHEYCGSTPEDMEGWGWRSVHDPAILPNVMDRWTRSIVAGHAFEMTFPLKGADGVFRPFLTRITPLKNVEGKVLRWLGNNVDLSRELAIEAELARSEAQFRTFAQAVPNMVWAASADGALEWNNDRVYEYTGRKRAILMAIAGVK